MERNIAIIIKDKEAYAPKDAVIVCNNSDYVLNFIFDDEWDGIDKKTARFVSNGKHTDVVFTGNTVNIPAIFNASYVKVGVFASDIATTFATVRCDKSILCEGGAVHDPTPDIYAQIIDLLNQISENKVTDEQVQEAVNAYLEENPIETGVNFTTDETLTLNEETNVLSVNRATEPEPDNTLPITSAAVYTTIGNINVLLETI